MTSSMNASSPHYNSKLPNTGQLIRNNDKPSNLELKKKLLSSGYGYVAENLNNGEISSTTYGITSQGSTIKNNSFLKGSNIKNQVNPKIIGRQSGSNTSFSNSIHNTNNSYLITNPTATSNYMSSSLASKMIVDENDLKDKVLKNMKLNNSNVKLGSMPQNQNYASSVQAYHNSGKSTSGHNSSNSYQVNFPSYAEMSYSKNNNYISGSINSGSKLSIKNDDKYNYSKNESNSIPSKMTIGNDGNSKEPYNSVLNQVLPDANSNVGKYSRNNAGSNKMPNQNFNTFNHTYLTPAPILPSNVPSVNVNVNHIRIDLNNEKKHMTYHNTETLDEENLHMKHQDPRIYNQSKMSNISSMSNNPNKRSESTNKEIERDALLNLELKLSKLMNSTVSDSRLSQSGNPIIEHFKAFTNYKKIFEEALTYMPEYSKIMKKINAAYNDSIQNIMISYNEAQEKLNETSELQTSKQILINNIRI